MRWATSTMAASSASVNCWARPAAVFDSTPPVAVILMMSAPDRTCSPHGAHAVVGARTDALGRQQVHDVVAVAVDVAVPAVDRDRRARGDDARPRHVAALRSPSRRAKMASLSPPRSATVVKPGHQGLPRVAGADHGAVGRDRASRPAAAPLGFCCDGQVDVAVDQPRQDEGVAQIDDVRALADEAVADFDDLVPYDHESFIAQHNAGSPGPPEAAPPGRTSFPRSREKPVRPGPVAPATDLPARDTARDRQLRRTS